MFPAIYSVPCYTYIYSVLNLTALDKQRKVIHAVQSLIQGYPRFSVDGGPSSSMRYYADIKVKDWFMQQGLQLAHIESFISQLERFISSFGSVPDWHSPWWSHNLVDPVDHLIFIKQRNFSIQTRIAQSHSKKKKHIKSKNIWKKIIKYIIETEEQGSMLNHSPIGQCLIAHAGTSAPRGIIRGTVNITDDTVSYYKWRW